MSLASSYFFFFFNDPPPTHIYTLSLHDALPILDVLHDVVWMHRGNKVTPKTIGQKRYVDAIQTNTDRKSTRLNSSHVKISYAVFCLKKKMKSGKKTRQ